MTAAEIQTAEQIGRQSAALEALVESFREHDREEVEERRTRAATEQAERERVYERLRELQARLDKIEGAGRAVAIIGSAAMAIVGAAVTIWAAIRG